MTTGEKRKIHDISIDTKKAFDKIQQPLMKNSQ